MINKQLDNLLTAVEGLDGSDLEGAAIVLKLKTGDVIFSGEDHGNDRKPA